MSHGIQNGTQHQPSRIKISFRGGYCLVFTAKVVNQLAQTKRLTNLRLFRVLIFLQLV
ncbi:Uncharacterized protein APZ42_009669 [Daphnia magna]|uniref:Uncharacterized protein n=1 Tax=Daphnia magna TaxID=35525 RepID=A0A164DVQ2_9CRUS|nr:Uncharacterized protein APZ42_009669 [Daphnia magna]